MFPTGENVLKQVNLETVTPEEALSLMQRLPADMMHSAHFTYYEGLFEAVRKIADAALRNREKQNGRKVSPV